MNKPYRTVFTLILCTAAFAAYSFAKPQKQPASQNLPSQETQFTAISIVRTINTAEAGFRFSKENDGTQHRNRYATWSDLYSSGILAEMKPPTDVSSLISSDGIRGYKLALIVSPDGQSYQLALHDAASQPAGFSVFTDQSGLIYTGSPLQ